MLLKAFPGRMLEELEQMDWGRWRRAVEAQTRVDVEDLRRNAIRHKGGLNDLPASVWATIREHDALVGDDDGEG